MKPLSTLHDRSRAFTLIEACAYIALLAAIIASFMPYASSIQEECLRIIDRVVDAEGA